MAPASLNAVLRTVPAQVDFLTIYNPTLGDTDENEHDQIIVWASRDDITRAQVKVASRKNDENTAAEGVRQAEDDGRDGQKVDAAEIGKRLRHIGLARGMLELANNFSNDQPVSSIETERSRIILHELENNWWILASVSVTKIPQQGATVGGKRPNSVRSSKEQKPSYEYSSREIAPAQLLLAQILRAHRIFLLHHCANLWGIYNKLGRPGFCVLMTKFWEKFVWNWDVLLHGSPAVEVYGCCTKLAGGGELGVGVGEEEWGSGEREVLEGLMERTEGLVDMVVGRYGSINQSENQEKGQKGDKDTTNQWLGADEDPGPANGVIFSGIGALTKPSLATVSQWMEAIFKHGQNAYGIGDNPNARPRQTRRKLQRSRPASENRLSDAVDDRGRKAQSQNSVRPRSQSPKDRVPDLLRQAMENNATPPGVPAPLVVAAHRQSEAQANTADKNAEHASKTRRKTSGKRSKSDEASKDDASSTDATSDNSGSSVFSTPNMLKVLSLGYGSSWTLNPKGWQDSGSDDVSKEPKQRRKSDQSAKNPDSVATASPVPKRPKLPTQSSGSVEGTLQEVDPSPAAEDEDQDSYRRRATKPAGRFLIGLPGDLDNTDLEEAGSDGENLRTSCRIHVRTLTVELSQRWRRRSLVTDDRGVSQTSSSSRRSAGEERSVLKTSAAASIDGPAQTSSWRQKVQVIVYVHQPFIFVFLFELHTPSLNMPSFYHTIHHQLGPLQSLLLKRTDPSKVAARIKEVIVSKDGGNTASTLAKMATAGNIVLDLVYDPEKLTIRTSIPNIPTPVYAPAEHGQTTKATTVSGSWYTLGIPIGAPTNTSTPSRALDQSDLLAENSLRNAAAEMWTRAEALNVHTQILNSWIRTRAPLANATSNLDADVASQSLNKEFERTVKTSRGWWVLWMRVLAPSTSPPSLPLDSATIQDQQRKPQSSSTSTSSASTVSARHKSATPTILAKEAFLVRKATDYSLSSHKASSSSRNSSGGRWLLRDQSKEPGRVSRGSGTMGDGTEDGRAGARSISEGVGIDARRWVEGLLHLSQ